MSKHEIITDGQLVYGGVSIREKGEMLSLTDMWRAAGSPNNREPFNWARKEGAAFIEAVSIAQNLPDSQVLKSKQGRNGGTFAHWQIGIAYAKYLSHEFHMWGNQAIREKMEGGIQHLPASVLENLERTNGICRMLAHKVTQIEQTLPVMLETMTMQAVAARMAEENLAYRRGVTAKQIWDRYNLPEKLRGSTLWLGNRLSEMGCGMMKADRGSSAVRIYDPDIADACMKNGLLHKSRLYASERMGQGKLKLIGGVA